MGMKDPAYLSAIHNLPCVICEKIGVNQTTPTEAHHTICGRYSQRKTPDRDAIPLCASHHRLGLNGDLAIHNGKKSWVKQYGLDTDYIEQTRRQIDES